MQEEKTFKDQCNQLCGLLPQIRKAAQRLCFEGVDPDDVTQAVMLKLLKTKAVPERIHAGWLHAVVRNAAVDAHKEQSKESSYVDRSVGLDITGSVCEGVDDNNRFYVSGAAAAQLEPDVVPALRKVLSTMRRCDRRTLLLRAAGFMYSEIAVITRANVNTVRSRMRNARRVLQSEMATYV